LAVPLWLATLKTFTKAVVWGTLFLNFAAMTYFSIRPEINTTFIVVTVLYVALVAFFRQKVMTAVDIIKIATRGLSETPSVFAACFVCFLMWALYIAFWEISIISSAAVLMLDQDGTQYGMGVCQLVQPSYVGHMRSFLIVCFIPTTFFFLNASLCACATGIGAWYFHADDPQRPRSPAFVGLKWAFFDSTGPVFVASLIQYAVHEIRKLINRNCNPCNPIWIAVRILWCFIERMVECFTKMMLLGHIFHGGGVIRTAKNSYQVLKNNLGQALTTDMVSCTVVNWSLIIFSVGFGIASCAWMDLMVGEGLLHPDNALTAFIPTEAVIILVCGMFLFFASYPLFSLVVVIGFLQGLLTAGSDGNPNNGAVGVFTGIFFSSITSIIMRFTGKIVHNCTDVVMYCIALEKETGAKQERFEDMYKVLNDQIGQGTATTNAGAVAQGREVTAPPAARFCPTTGKPLEPAAPPGAKFCPQTGKPLDPQTGLPLDAPVP